MVEEQSIWYIMEHGISGFRSEYFVDLLTEFNYIKDFHKKYGKVPDMATFMDKFPLLKPFPVSDPRESLIDRLKEEAFAKKLIPIYNKCSELIENGDSIKAASMMSETIAELRKTLSKSIASIDITDYQYKTSAYKELKEGLITMNTGFKELDDLFGGWSNEDLVVLFARLGVGKSWMAIRFAYELVKQGKRVGFYAGEMSAQKISLRMDSFNTGISNFSLLMGRVPEDSYAEIAKSMSDLPGKMLVLTPKELGDSATVEDLKNFIETDRLDVLFVDQISLIKRDNRKSTHDAIATIANGLRIVQAVSQIPVFIVSQQNRSSLHDAEVGAEHIAQSDDIGQNATIAINFDYDKETKILTQNIVKSRNSEGAKLRYLWDIDKGRMIYIPHEEAVQNTTDETEYDDKGGSPF